MGGFRFKQVDVFSAVPFKGNPVAVVLDAGTLSSADMQQIANWTNLSETTFVVPATELGADYQVRIFTPHAELPFAGHPTIGTAHALLEAGLVTPRAGKLVQQCRAGLITLTVDERTDEPRWIAFDLPEPKLTPLDANQLGVLQAMLGTPLARATPCLVDVGPRWVVAQLPDAAAVLAVRPDVRAMAEHHAAQGMTGLVLFGEHASGHSARIEVRAFAPAHGIPEDPVCGSGNGCVAAFIRATGQTTHFGSDLLSAQGAALGRAGLLRLTMSDAAIRVAGNAITCVEGSLAA
jgi:PhzF family phenazine biosynthesis protein